MYTSIYSNNIPPSITQLVKTPEMQRLDHVGMHCGVEYAGYPKYKNEICPYSRLTHSIGVAYIVWHFTHDLTMTIAGLLHDISTPVFAHTIDFLNGDHLKQESTEEETRKIIENSKEIMEILNRLNIMVDDVCDYHLYPIADNDTPMLSADRLEYTFGTAYVMYHLPTNEIKNIYDNIHLATNEQGIAELAFDDISIAKRFTHISLRNSHMFVDDEDRFSMQFLADIVRHAIKLNVITKADLYTTEEIVIDKMNTNNEIAKMWQEHTLTYSVLSSSTKPIGKYSVNIDAKKRYINSLVKTTGNGGIHYKRIMDIDKDIASEINTFLNMDFNRWLFAESVHHTSRI
ncbi:MAG: HD domain-containing protein [Suipraeoptans sp.]